MTSQTPTLHLLCGKIASGKSTLARRLSAPPGTVLISQDTWLAALFSDQLTSGPDYVRCSARLWSAMAPHVSALLNEGMSVVLDFPANTVQDRAGMRAILADTNALHQLHILDTPDALCLARLRERNASGSHDFAPSEEMFHRFSRHFTRPSADEGFTLVIHTPPD